MKLINGTILYAEDERTDALLFERALRRAGVTNKLVVVSNGAEAIDYLRAGHQGHVSSLPLVVLLDVNMPAMSGFEVLQWIRRTDPSLVTLMLSSSHHSSDIRHAYDLGANGYLVKPSSIEETISLATALKRYWLTENDAGRPSRPGSASEMATSSAGVMDMANWRP
jgi:CheY-like chemotaxis protein